ncbi:MAG: DUF1598 domain-containing protein, partial [Thermoguttaceae bacterium]|nr:DUF1598 domain-containing protein [Thermoguttaceae bacterium]
NNNNNNNNKTNNNPNTSNYDQSYYRWGYRSAVGGVAIDADRILRSATQQELAATNAQLMARMESIPADLEQPCAERKISLARLNDLLVSCRENNEQIPDAARYLGGLTAIDYVVADPAQKDVYLVGHAEPWTLGESGVVVGTESGKPILHLEDLLVALRALSENNKELVSCSIDPSAEAIARLAAREDVTNVDLNREAMGAMNVTLTGVPADSRMANVLVAADYRMKRLSLGFDEAAIKNFSSYFSMVKRGSSSYGQRFWMEPKYDALYRDADSLVWKVSASSVDVLTEREYFAADGSRKASVQNDPAATKWASNMKKRYAELAKVEPIFADAKNCMDVVLVAALIYSQKLQAKADCQFDELLGVETPEYVVPASVASDSIVRADSRSVASVTGGVLINPWETIANNKVDANLNGFAVEFSGSNFYAD